MSYFHVVAENLFCIYLNQKRHGWNSFICSWLFWSEKLTFLVDPGPSFSLGDILRGLKKLGVFHLDYILITHIHIDHAGGLSRLLQAFPDACVCCHPSGFQHLINPEKLWAGTQQVLGSLALEYGEIFPVPAENLFFYRAIPTALGEISVYETPGHAPHHLCFGFDSFLFCGEVAGIYYETESFVYQRPATPPRFDLEISLGSLESMMSLHPEMLIFGHSSIARCCDRVLQWAHHQLLLWVDVIAEQLRKGELHLADRVCACLLEKDPVFAQFHMLPVDMRRRELYFFNNTLAGMRGYLQFREKRLCQSP